MMVINYHRHVFANVQEEYESRKLSTLQRANIENLLRECVEEKVHIPATDDKFLLRQEFMRGQLVILNYLLALDDAATSEATSTEQL